VAITAIFDTNILFSATGWRWNPLVLKELRGIHIVRGSDFLKILIVCRA
jgi:hypothetical protein